jgi:uncharacterized membrane protein
MNSKNMRIKSLIIEAAIAGLLGGLTAVSTDAQDNQKPMPQKKGPAQKNPGKKTAEKIHCFGVNSCKGTSECAVDGKSGCHAQNACKGQGWISLTEKQCIKKKGTVLK